MSDPGHYRSKDELTAERERDCLVILKNIIMSKKLATDADFEHWDEEALEVVEDAVQFAEESPDPELSEIWTDIFV